MSRTTVTALGTAAILAAGALAAPVAVAGPAGAVTAPAVVRATTVPRPDVRVHYLAATHTGTTSRLQLVSRTTGVVVATLATAPMYTYKGRSYTPWAGATIAPDGTVWTVQHAAGPYTGKLVRISGGRLSVVMSYVMEARVSPDGKRLAVTTLSPDTNHDGKVSMTVGVAQLSGAGFKALASQVYKVDRAGEPLVVDYGPLLETWLGNHKLVVSTTSGDGSRVAVMSADAPSASRTWPRVDGDWDTMPIAKVGTDAALIPVATYAKDGFTPTGWDIYRMSATQPKAVKLAHVAADTKTSNHLADYVATVKATPIVSWAARMPFRPVKGVTLDSIFLER